MPTLLRIAVLIATACMLPAGCLSSPRPEITIYEGPQGAVYLERAADRNFQAAHPIKLEPHIIARVLEGVYIRDDKTTIQTLLGSAYKSARVFSDEETEFLTPLLITALGKATAGQRVNFKVVNRTASGPETTAATLYAHGLSLHLTLLEYRHKPDRADDIHMPNRRLPDPSGLSHRNVIFLPEAAKRPATYQRAGFFGQSDEATLVIDYGYLAKEQHTSSSPLSQAAPPIGQASADDTLPRPSMGTVEPVRTTEHPSTLSEEIQSLKDLVIKKDMEVETLKQELRALRRQLADRDAQLDTLKRKSKAPSK